MVGTPFLHALLQYYDPEFQKMFKIKADFDTDMERTPETEKQMAQFIATCLKRENGLPFDASGVAEVIDCSSRLADDQERISTEFNKITEIVVESTAWAKAEKSDTVRREHVQRAIKEKRFRSDLIQEKIARAYQDGLVRIDTSGEMVGQINGLSVIDLMDYRFGHPSRITANVFMGQEGVVNIEREVKLTGPIHNKGLLILTSYMGRKYAQDMPLSLSAKLTFEQMYGGIDGDSASSTELYCLLSALSEVPLKQGIAVTGSVRSVREHPAHRRSERKDRRILRVLPLPRPHRRTGRNSFRYRTHVISCSTNRCSMQYGTTSSLSGPFQPSRGY